MDVVGRKIVKTRVCHICFGCGRKFEQGTMMERRGRAICARAVRKRLLS